MTKKIYKQKCFSLLITKNLNWEILTKNLVIFKRRDGVKDENFWYDGVSLKNLIFKGVVHEKPIYRKRNCLKRGRGLGQIAELRGGWQKSRGRKGHYHSWHGGKGTGLAIWKNVVKTINRLHVYLSLSSQVNSISIVRKGVLSPPLFKLSPSPCAYLPHPPPPFSKIVPSPQIMMGLVGEGWGYVLNARKGGGRRRGLPKLNKGEQEGRGNPNIGPCVIT